MREIFLLENTSQVQALVGPLRLAVLRHLSQPATNGEIAALLGESPQKTHYHLKALEEAGLVERVDERKVRGIMEGVYQATARSYWLSPALTGEPGARRRVGGQVNLGFLVTLAESVQSDLARLAKYEGDVPSLAFALDIDLKDSDAKDFLREARATVEKVSSKYAGKASRSRSRTRFRLALACYPGPGDKPPSR